MLAGPIVLAIAIVVIMPITFLITGGVIAAIYSYLLPATVDDTHEGSELIELNK